MIFYFKILSSLFASDIILSKIDKRTKIKIITVLFFIVLLLISSLRSVNVGTDMNVYFSRYSIIGETSFNELYKLNELWGFEYGYMIFNKIMFSISTSYYFFTFVTSGFILFSFYKFMYKYSSNITVSYTLFILLYFFGTSLNLIRLFLAISINLFSIKYLIDRDFARFLPIVLLATTFHTTAIVFLILYPLYNFKFTTNSIVFLTGALVFIKLFSTQILNFLLSFHVYGKRYGDELGSGDGKGILLFHILILVIALIQKQHKNNRNHLWLIMLVTSVIFNLLALNLTIAARVMWYFKPTFLILIPEILENKPKKNLVLHVLLSCIILVYPLYHTFQRVSADNEGIFPYETVITQEND